MCGNIKISPHNQQLLQDKFNKVKEIKDKIERGYKLEEIIQDLLRYSGHNPKRKRGITNLGDQIDLFAEIDKNELLVECRFQKKKVGQDDIQKFHTSLARRPHNIIGIYFSMSEYSEGVYNFVSKELKPLIILFNRIEIECLMNGSEDFDKLLREKIHSQSQEGKLYFRKERRMIDRSKDIIDAPRYHDIFIGNKKVDYCSSKSSETGCVVFSPSYYSFKKRNYLIEAYIPSMEYSEFYEILDTYNSLFGVTESASFCINQTNYSWFGLDVNNFLSALKNRNKRYKRFQNIKKHHTEAVTFMDEFYRGIFSLSAQPSIEGDRIRHVSINFMFEEMPFNVARYQKFFETLDFNAEYIETLDYQMVTLLDLKKYGNISVKKVGEVREKWMDDIWIKGLLCKNPFHGKNIELIDDKDNNKFLGKKELLSSIEYLLTYMPHYHTLSTKIKDYNFREIRIGFVHSSGFPTLLVNVIVDWE